jgi:hypothetical protein
MGRLQERAQRLVTTAMAKYEPADAAARACRTSGAYNVICDPNNEHLVMDVDTVPWLLAHPGAAGACVAVIDSIEVNRKGGLSCPVRTGAVLACCHTHTGEPQLLPRDMTAAAVLQPHERCKLAPWAPARVPVHVPHPLAKSARLLRETHHSRCKWQWGLWIQPLCSGDFAEWLHAALPVAAR